MASLTFSTLSAAGFRMAGNELTALCNLQPLAPGVGTSTAVQILYAIEQRAAATVLQKNCPDLQGARDALRAMARGRPYTIAEALPHLRKLNHTIEKDRVQIPESVAERDFYGEDAPLFFIDGKRTSDTGLKLLRMGLKPDRCLDEVHPDLRMAVGEHVRSAIADVPDRAMQGLPPATATSVGNLVKMFRDADVSGDRHLDLVSMLPAISALVYLQYLTSPDFRPLPLFLFHRILDHSDELTVRSLNALTGDGPWRLGLTTIGEIAFLHNSELMRTRNFGRQSLANVQDFLARRGLSLGMNYGLQVIYRMLAAKFGIELPDALPS